MESNIKHKSTNTAVSFDGGSVTSHPIAWTGDFALNFMELVAS